MRRALFALAGILTAGVPSTLLAQAPAAGRPAGAAPGGAPQLPAGRGEVRGTAVEATSGSAVPRASATVRAKGSTAIVAGAIAGADGVFRIQGLRNGAYTVRVTYLGFAPLVQEFNG